MKEGKIMSKKNNKLLKIPILCALLASMVPTTYAMKKKHDSEICNLLRKKNTNNNKNNSYNISNPNFEYNENNESGKLSYPINNKTEIFELDNVNFQNIEDNFDENFDENFEKINKKIMKEHENIHNQLMKMSFENITEKAYIDDQKQKLNKTKLALQKKEFELNAKEIRLKQWEDNLNNREENLKQQENNFMKKAEKLKRKQSKYENYDNILFSDNNQMNNIEQKKSISRPKYNDNNFIDIKNDIDNEDKIIENIYNNNIKPNDNENKIIKNSYDNNNFNNSKDKINSDGDSNNFNSSNNEQE